MTQYTTRAPDAPEEHAQNNWRSIGELARELVDRAAYQPKEAAE